MMRKFLIFVALCAICQAAPAPELDRPSPINPDVVSDPKPAEKVVLVPEPVPSTEEQPKVPAEAAIQHISKGAKREAHHEHGHDDSAPEKPHSVIAHESLQHKDHTERPAGVAAHGSLEHDHKKVKREAHHEHGHDDSAPEKPHSVTAHESLQHKDHTERPGGVAVHDSLEHDHKNVKRDHSNADNVPQKPHSVIAHESLQHNPSQAHPVQLPGVVSHDQKKVKRQATTKPIQKDPEVLVPHGSDAEEPASDAGKNRGNILPRLVRDIPVPTQVKEKHTAEEDKPQVEALAPITPISHPVGELFNKDKQDKEVKA